MRIGALLGLGFGALAGMAASLLYARDLEREVDELRHELDDLRGRAGARPGPTPGDRGPADQPASDRQTAAQERMETTPEDPYDAQVRAREEGRRRPEERGDYEMIE